MRIFWLENVFTSCPHHFVILNPSSCSLGVFALNSFKVLYIGLSEGFIKGLASRQFIDQVSVLCITSPYTLTLLLLLLFASLVPKILLKKAHFWSWCISSFCGWFLFFLPFTLFCSSVGWSCIFQYSVETDPREMPSKLQKRHNTCSLKGCSNLGN